MDMKSVCLCVLVFTLQFVCGQYSTTPCPGVFDFENDGQHVYGKITLRPVAPVSSLVLRINFTVAARLINEAAKEALLQRLLPVSNIDAQRFRHTQILIGFGCGEGSKVYGIRELGSHGFHNLPSLSVHDRTFVHTKCHPDGATTKVSVTFSSSISWEENYVGTLEALNSHSVLQRYNQGQTVDYLVHFPVISPLPKLTALTVNGDTICYGPGDLARPNVYITTLSLQHTSFLEGGASAAPFYNNFQHQPQTRPQIRPQPRPQEPIRQTTVDHIHYGEDEATAHIYTFNNIEPTWPTDNSPNYVVNNTNQFTQATQQYQPPTQQIFHSRPIYQYSEPSSQVTSRRPVRPMTPVYTEPLTERPVYAPPTVARPNPNDFYSPDAPTAVTSPDRYSNTPDETIECGTVSGGNNRIPLIYNGNAYDRGELPWLVAIFKSEQASIRFICGGTLVTDRHIVTAAHCMQRRGTLTSVVDIVVKIGVHKLNDWSDDITVTRNIQAATLHESYNPATLQNDILVLTLDKRVTFNHYIRPACLWSGNTDLSVVVGRKGVVAGWGDQGVGGIGKQAEPHKVDVPIVSTNDCRASKSLFHELTFDTTLCAGDRQGSGPCVGDSGGGMYLLQDGKWRVRGVVSVSLRADNGDATCNLNEYVVFTDVAQFLPWIKNILAQN